MLSSRPRIVVALVALAAGFALTACDPHTITIRFDPEVGDQFQFQSNIRTEVHRTVDGVREDVVVDEATLEAMESVTGVGDEEVTVDVAITRDGAPGRTYSARFSRGDHLTAADLIEGAASDAVGLDLAANLPADLTSPPDGPLEPGARWTIERAIDTGDRTIVVTGEGRVRSLGVLDGRDVAVVEVELRVPIRSSLDTPNGQVRLVGVQTSESRTTYDLIEGTVRSDRTSIDGEVQLVIEPPADIDAEPVNGTITYSVNTDTKRVTAA